MSYIPDYRCEDNMKHLNDADKSYLNGYKKAIEDSMNFFNNLDVFNTSDLEIELLEKIHVKECLQDWLNSEERLVVCSVFEWADYIPEDIDIIDIAKGE